MITDPEQMKDQSKDQFYDIKPADFTFTLWILIFFLNFVFAVAQVSLAFIGGEKSLWINNKVRYYLSTAFILNGIWLPVNAAKLNWCVN